MKRKEDELSRTKNRSTISEEDEEVLWKRIEMTEEAFKAERDKSNVMEDVRWIGLVSELAGVTAITLH